MCTSSFRLFPKFHSFANNSLCKLNSSFQLSRLATVFCDQHYPKTRLPSHHLRVRRRCLFEWDGLDHGGHAAQGTESERGITGRRVPRQRACYLALSEYEIHARDLDRLRSDAEVNGHTAGSKALEGLSDCFASRRRYDDDLGAAKGLQSGCGVSSGTVNVVMSAELLSELRCVAAAGNRRHLEPNMPGVLHRQMTKAADTEHSDEVTRLRWCVSQGVDHRESRAKHRRSICRRQIVRDTHQPGGLRDHHLSISAIRMNARVSLVTTVHEITVSTKFAITARAREEANTYALTVRPALDTRAKGIDP